MNSAYLKLLILVFVTYDKNKLHFIVLSTYDFNT